MAAPQQSGLDEARAAFEFLRGAPRPESVSLDELRAFERHGLLSTTRPYWIFADSWDWPQLRPLRTVRVTTVDGLATLDELGSKWWHGYEPEAGTLVNFKLLPDQSRAVVHLWQPASDDYVVRATVAWHDGPAYE